uniref:MARVEL domain-containing protein n=1 Tax=Anser brachyrhynchus TaxID=132585 RepID=A0A8B9C6G6_9AVES
MLNQAVFSPPTAELCNKTEPGEVHLVGDFSSSAQFFVTVAVFAFLYSMAALAVYLGYFHLYRGAGGKLPLADFLATVAFSFLWLVSTSAWAKALTDVKISTAQPSWAELRSPPTHAPPLSAVTGTCPPQPHPPPATFSTGGLSLSPPLHSPPPDFFCNCLNKEIMVERQESVSRGSPPPWWGLFWGGWGRFGGSSGEGWDAERDSRLVLLLVYCPYPQMRVPVRVLVSACPRS